MSEYTCYSYPGIILVNEVDTIISQINDTFNLKDNSWVTTRSRERRFAFPRQLLMSCLLDFCDYTLRSAGEVCLRDHATANYAWRQVHETLMQDREYGERFKQVYKFLDNGLVRSTKHKGGFAIK